jgi:hypothetical protein
MVVSRTPLFVSVILVEQLPPASPLPKIATLPFWGTGNRKDPFEGVA